MFAVVSLLFIHKHLTSHFQTVLRTALHGELHGSLHPLDKQLAKWRLEAQLGDTGSVSLVSVSTRRRHRVPQRMTRASVIGRLEDICKTPSKKRRLVKTCQIGFECGSPSNKTTHPNANKAHAPSFTHE